MKIWLDDIRPMPEGFDFWCKDESEVRFLINHDNVTHVDFDHDLGSSYTGYDLAKYIEQRAFDRSLKPITWNIHSQNPVGRKNIETAMRNADKYWYPE